MPTSTAKYALPRPSPGDPADGPDGFNDLTDALDPLIATHAAGTTAARPAAGKAGRFYWNTDSAALEYDTGTAWAPIRPVAPVAGTLPTTNLYEGQLAYYQNASMASAGVVWTFRYRATAGTYKWEFVGGPPILAKTTGRAVNNAIVATTYTQPASALTLTLPALEGDYDIQLQSLMGHDRDAVASFLVSYTLGAVTSQTELDKWALNVAFGNTITNMAKNYRHINVPAGIVLSERARHNVSGPQSVLYDTAYVVTPVRVK